MPSAEIFPLYNAVAEMPRGFVVPIKVAMREWSKHYREQWKAETGITLHSNLGRWLSRSTTGLDLDKIRTSLKFRGPHVFPLERGGPWSKRSASVPKKRRGDTYRKKKTERVVAPHTRRAHVAVYKPQLRAEEVARRHSPLLTDMVRSTTNRQVAAYNNLRVELHI